jgi:UDP-N-acetylmuramoyl-tripeptide--D-alanyl-D-alanine ligase
MKKHFLSTFLSFLFFIKNRLVQIRLKILYALAIRQRRRLNHVTFIGITGSAGKTITKDLTAAILAGLGLCRKTHISYNSASAVTAAVLHTAEAHRYCVAEIAASGPGTMDQSVQLFKPDIAVLTLIGRDHYSAYKSMDKLAAEKEKLITALSPQGTAILNIDDALVRAIGERCDRRVIWIGEGAGATLRLLETYSRWPEPLTLSFEYQNRTYKVQTQLHGTHMALSILASLGIALAAGLPLEKAIAVIAQVQPNEGRMQPVRGDDGVVFIRDDFKAPHWSLNAPMAFMKEAQADRKIVVLGTISDSSMDDTRKYKKVCRQFLEVADIVVFVGSSAHRALRARKSENETAIQGFSNIRSAANYLQALLRKGDLVLLKGSHRADHLVRLVLNRYKPIKCWKDKCPEGIFCDHCPELYRRFPFTSLVAPFILRGARKLDTDA